MFEVSGLKFETSGLGLKATPLAKEVLGLKFDSSGQGLEG